VSIFELASRLSGWPRRLLALSCVLLAAITALGDRRAPPTKAEPVVVAARDLPAGSRLAASDVRVRAWPADLRPSGAVTRPAQVIGRRLAGPIRVNEAVTGTRLDGADLTAGLPAQLQAVPVELTGGAPPGLVHAGDVIDLLAGDQFDGEVSATPSSRVLAEAVQVLSVVSRPADSATGAQTSGLIVAADRQTALRIAAASGRPIVANVRKPP
jgi:pilus assembly protein CpaB